MSDVACFCGCVYVSAGDLAVCPNCGEYAALNGVAIEEEAHTRLELVSQKRLVDRVIEAYVAWREACLRVSDAYGCWGTGAGPGARSAFAVYVAALDQEERAAEVYAGLMRRAGQRVLSKHDGVAAGSRAAC